MLYTATTLGCPAAVRYPRGTGPGVPIVPEMTRLPVGRAEVRRTGRHGIAILAFGSMVAPAERIAERHDMTLLNMRFVKPLDAAAILEVAEKHQGLVTIEENVIAGGAGSSVAECLAAASLCVPILNCGIPDRFIEHGSRTDCIESAGLDAASLEAAILRWWRKRSLQLTA
ncbi:MAG: transketolase C-terminal domain-containing protein, partial [Steroidobacteraceae bacterium]